MGLLLAFRLLADLGLHPYWHLLCLFLSYSVSGLLFLYLAHLFGTLLLPGMFASSS